MIVEERKMEVEGLPTRYLTAGEGPPLLLLHGVGDDALDWRWVMPALASYHRVYAPDLPGSGNSAKPLPDYSPAFFTRFVGALLDALEVDRAAVVGNSLGSLVSLRLALSTPERVTALGLVDSAGLGREVTYALRSLALPGYGKLAVAWGKRPPGAVQSLLRPVLIASRLPTALARRRTAGVGDSCRLLLTLPLLTQFLVLFVILDARPVVFGHVAPSLSVLPRATSPRRLYTSYKHSFYAKVSVTIHRPC
jgi:pimeloyl-ACP methyl ester carboxylesterase